LSDLRFFSYFPVFRPEWGCRGPIDPRTTIGIFVRSQEKKILGVEKLAQKTEKGKNNQKVKQSEIDRKGVSKRVTQRSNITL